MITGGKADVNARDEHGTTPLLLAIMYMPSDEPAAPMEIIRSLIEAGADVNATDKNGWTSLHHASIRSQAETIRTLTHAGADVDAKNKAGHTASAIQRRLSQYINRDNARRGLQ